jgi:cellulose biosynthesis protein BcsQ
MNCGFWPTLKGSLLSVHVLSVSSLKGGVGKTTVALGLASAAFARGLRTLVVDLDSQCDASTGLGVIEETEATVLEVLQNPRHSVVLSSIVSSPWAKGRTGQIDVMVGNTASASFDSMTPDVRDVWKLEEALSHVETKYDLVIIDTPPSLGGLLRTAWAASDRVLVVAEPGIFAVSSVERSLKAIAELHDSLNERLAPVGVVVNRSQQNFVEHGYRQNELRELAGEFYLDVDLQERAATQQAQGAARPIHSWPGEGAAELSSSFDRLLEIVLSSFKEAVSRNARRRGRGQITSKRNWFRRNNKKADLNDFQIDNLDD